VERRHAARVDDPDRSLPRNSQSCGPDILRIQDDYEHDAAAWWRIKADLAVPGIHRLPDATRRQARVRASGISVAETDQGQGQIWRRQALEGGRSLLRMDRNPHSSRSASRRCCQQRRGWSRATARWRSPTRLESIPAGISASGCSTAHGLANTRGAAKGEVGPLRRANRTSGGTPAGRREAP